MTAQEYYQGHPQNPTPYSPPESPPQYHSPTPQHGPSFKQQQQRPPYPQNPQASSPFLHPGTPQPQPWQLPFLPPPNQHVQQRPLFPTPIQTQPPYAQSQGPPPQAFGAHLRPTRSYSEPPSPRDYERHRRRHQSHGRRRSPSRSSDSDSESDSSSRSRSRSRERHHRRHRGSEASRGIDGPRERERGYWADKARGKKNYLSGKNDHTARNTFLGAFGGGAIGDLIAPGLGTLGGAILGGVGAHGTGRSRNGSSKDGGHSRTRIRDRYDEEWEEGRRRRGEI